MAKNTNTGGKIAIGAAIGVAAGAVAGFITGILTAPKSGKETRGDIKDTAVKTKGQVEKTVGEAKNKAEDVVEDVKGKAREIKGRAEAAVEGALKTPAKKPVSKK